MSRPSLLRADDTISLRVSFFDPGFKPVMQALIDRFSASHPGIAVTMQTPADSWDAQLQRTILDERTGDAAELAVQGYNRLRIVAENRAAVPLDPLIAAESGFVGQGYTTALMSLGKQDGKQWGLPLAISNPVLFYNADLLKQAKVDPDRFAG